MQQSLLLVMLGLLLASTARSAALIERTPSDFYLVTVQAEQVHGQECGTLKPLLKNGPTALEDCQKHTGKKSYSIPLKFYEQAFQSFYGVPTPTNQDGSSLAELALEEERTARSPESVEEGSRAGALARVLTAYDRIFDPMLSGALQVKAADKDASDLLLGSFWPVFSDGEMVVRLTAAVPGAEFKTACPIDWVPMSIAAASSIQRKEEFRTWLKQRIPNENLLFWVGHYFMQAYTVEKSEAYSADSSLYALTVDDSFVSAALPAPTVANWNLPLKSIPSAAAVVSSQHNNSRLRALCFRRVFPDALNAAPSANSKETLEALAKSYKQSDPAFFRRVALQFPEIDRGTAGLALLRHHVPGAKEIAQIEPALKEFFKPELPTVEELQKIIKDRKAREAAEAKAAQELAAAERQRKWEEAQAEQRRKNEAAALASRNRNRSDAWGNSAGTEYRWSDGQWRSSPQPGTLYEGRMLVPGGSSSGRTTSRYRDSGSSGGTTITYEWPDGSYRSTKYRGPGYYYESDR